MSPLIAGLLGVIEGITEFLPISSTGHLILASRLLLLGESDFQKSFEIIIQLGAILAVIAWYWKSFLNLETLKRLFVAFLPTGIIGLLLYKVVKTYLLGNEAVVLWALLIGGIILIAFEMRHKEPEGPAPAVSEISYRKSFFIGLFQAVSIIPGTSRSAATIVGGLALGLPRRTIVEFSFLLAVPTMIAASGLDLVKNASSFSSSDALILAIGFVVSFIVALVSIKFLLGYVRKHTFIAFGIYRIAIALLFWVILF